MRNFSSKHKKGFTLTEIVIVIAVLAILSAIAVPAVSSMVKNSRISSLKKSLTHVNKQVDIACANNSFDTSIDKTNDFLIKHGVSPNDADGLDLKIGFFQNETHECYVLYNAQNVIIFPDNLNGVEFSDNTLVPEEPDDKKTVTKPEHLLWFMNQLNNNVAIGEIIIDGDIDFYGNEFFVSTLYHNLTIRSTEGNIFAIKNIRNKDTTKMTESSGFALFGYVGNITLKFENIIFEDIQVLAKYISDCAVLVGVLDGTLTLNNVTIKNCSVLGNSNVGSLVGYLSSGTSLSFSTFAINDVDLYCVSSYAGKIIGYAHSPTTASTSITSQNNQIEIVDCTTGVYENNESAEFYESVLIGNYNQKTE